MAILADFDDFQKINLVFSLKTNVYRKGVFFGKIRIFETARNGSIQRAKRSRRADQHDQLLSRR